MRAQTLAPSAIAEVGEISRANGPSALGNLIDLAEGDPSFATPVSIVDRAMEGLHAGLTHYGSTRGLKTLRSLILDTAKELDHTNYDPETNIVITPGAKFAIYASLMCTVDPGDPVVIIDPSWVSYDHMVRLAGGVPVHL